MKKGFTLVELLAVLILIAIISTFVIANIIDKSNDFNNISSEQLQEVIIGSAKAYVNDRESLKNDIRSGSTVTITKSDLERNNYIKNNLKMINKKYDNFCVIVTYNGSYNYNFSSDSSVCSQNNN